MRFVPVAFSYYQGLYLLSDFRVKHGLVDLAPDKKLLLLQSLGFLIVGLVLNVNQFSYVELHELDILKLLQVCFLQEEDRHLPQL